MIYSFNLANTFILTFQQLGLKLMFSGYKITISNTAKPVLTTTSEQRPSVYNNPSDPQLFSIDTA
jgi:hypothetical protein